MVVASVATERAELVKSEVIRNAIESDGPLMEMLELSLAQVAAGVPLIPLDEAKALFPDD